MSRRAPKLSSDWWKHTEQDVHFALWVVFVGGSYCLKTWVWLFNQDGGEIIKRLFYGALKTFCARCDHICIFRLWWWRDSGFWWSWEAGQLPDWRDRGYETNTGRNETAHQQCEFRGFRSLRIVWKLVRQLKCRIPIFLRFLRSPILTRTELWTCPSFSMSFQDPLILSGKNL